MTHFKLILCALMTVSSVGMAASAGADQHSESAQRLEPDEPNTGALPPGAQSAPLHVVPNGTPVTDEGATPPVVDASGNVIVIPTTKLDIVETTIEK